MFDKNTLAQLEAGYQSTRQTQKSKSQPQTKKSPSLLSLVPSAAAAAASLIPGVGTVGATVLGGLGEAARQRLAGEKFDLGKVGKEAALSAIPGGLGKAGKIIKGVKETKAASEAARAAEQIASQQRTANAGRAVVGSAIKNNVGNISKQAADATQFNNLAKQNIQRLAQENAQQGLPLANGGGTLVKPGKTPSFASEGIELQVVPKVPDVPNRYKNIADASTPQTPTITASEGVTSKPTLLSKMSTSRTKAASGLKADTGVGGIERADEAAQTFQRLGISGPPNQQLRKITQVMQSHGKQVDDILAKNPIQLDGTAVKAQVAKAIEDPLKYPDLDLTSAGAQKALMSHLDKYASATNAKEVNDYIKKLNPIAIRAQSKLDKGAALTDKESAALAAKKAGDEVLSQYPEIAPLKKDMATLFERNGDVTKASEKTVGVPLLGVKSKSLAQAKAGVQSKVAAGLNTVDKAAQGKPGVVGKSLLGQLTTRGAAGVGGAIVQGQSPNNTDTTNQTTNTITNTANTASTMPQLSDGTAQTASNSDFFSDPEQVKQAYLQALNNGDTETANAIVKGYETFGATAGAGKPLSAESAKVVSNAQTGIQALTDFNNLIANDPSAFGRTNIPGVGVLDKVTSGRVSGALGTSGLNAARQQVIDVIARLRTGAAISADEAARFEQFVPQPGDPPEVQQQKSNYLLNQFQMVAQRSGSLATDQPVTTGVQ